MTDKIDILREASKFFAEMMDHTNPDDEFGAAAAAIDRAIDQLRWRRVEDELPEDGQKVLAVDCVSAGRVCEYQAKSCSFDDFYGEEFTEVEWWQPIDLPEDE